MLRLIWIKLVCSFSRLMDVFFVDGKRLRKNLLLAAIEDFVKIFKVEISC